MLRDRLVLEYNSSEAKRELLQEETLDLDRALKTLQSFEVVDASKPIIHSQATPFELNKVLLKKKGPNRKDQTNCT